MCKHSTNYNKYCSKSLGSGFGYCDGRATFENIENARCALTLVGEWMEKWNYLSGASVRVLLL